MFIWWYINVSSNFYLFFQIGTNDVPSTKHKKILRCKWWIITEALMNQRWNMYAYLIYNWIQNNETAISSNFIISNQIEQDHELKRQKSSNSDSEREKSFFPIFLKKSLNYGFSNFWAKRLTGVLKADFNVSMRSFWSKNLSGKNVIQFFFRSFLDNFWLIFPFLLSTCSKFEQNCILEKFTN